ncbi:MAG: hypothetical protein IH624_18820 [Phycisphaerae bacterium]|nr:hypothetical protein [Phycisphaerae bacterium]
MRSRAGLYCAIIAALGLCSAGVGAGVYSGGAGTPEVPYRVGKPGDLIELGNTLKDHASHFVLTKDIDLAGRGNSDDGSYFVGTFIARDTGYLSPTTFEGTEFTGRFQGNGFTIRNLAIDTHGENHSYLGLFGSVGAGGVVENLRLENVRIVGGTDCRYVGGLCGRSDGLIRNSSVRGAAVQGGYFVGGLCGKNRSGTITGSFSDGFAAGQFCIGGLCGGNSEYANWAGVIELCSSGCEVMAVGDKASYKFGGLCGENWATIRQSNAWGLVRGENWFGGLCGGNYGTIFDCYAGGDVRGAADIYSSGAGGLCGRNDRGKIIRCYSSGYVSASEAAGGLCGIAITDGTYAGHGVTYEDTANFWDVDRSGLEESAMGTGLSRGEMQNRLIFAGAGWDFGGEAADWRIRDGEDYPRLAWEAILPGDMAGSPGVDLADLMVVADHWMQSCSGCPADVNGDGVVNMADVGILGGYWMSGVWGIARN